MRRRPQSWVQWRERRLRELRKGGLAVDLSQRLVDIEIAARKRLGRQLGRDAARNAELVLTAQGNLALSVDAKHISPKSGALDLAWFYGADPKHP